MKPEQDAYGQLLYAHLTGTPGIEILERDDGYIAASLGSAVYFAPYEEWDEAEREIVSYSRGRVLDVGSGAGRHVLYLQEKGFDVVATDNSPLAIEVCKQRGVKDARVMPATQLTRKVGRFGSLLMMRHNFGLMGNPSRAKWLLRRFYHLTTPDGRIITGSRNPYGTDDPAHLAYHARNRQHGRMGGQIRMRVRFRQYSGPWFDHLMVTPDEMRQVLDGTGWKIAHLTGNPNNLYYVVLEKSSG